jgi:hypothetical protein
MKYREWFVAFVVIEAAGCSRFERPEASYASYSEAEGAGALGPGSWIPEFLPVSAIDIREQHNIDTNERWLRFSFTGDFKPPDSCSSTGRLGSVDARTPEWWKEEAGQKPAHQGYACIERHKIGDGWSESRCQLLVSDHAALYRCSSDGQAQQSVQPDRREDAAPG